MVRSNIISDIKKLYDKLPLQTLLSLTNTEKDKAYIKFAKKFINKRDRILDLGCGYGRITIPLKEQKFNIEGIDISSKLIKEARRRAKKKNLNIRFKLGDMRDLPYKDNSFDKILCLWAAFNHLTNKRDQIKTLNECFRVLRDGGILIMDIPDGRQFMRKNNIRENYRIHIDNINGIKFRIYVHDRKSLIDIVEKSKFKKYKIYKDKIYTKSKERLIFILEKTNRK